jgi:hypothetical protein
MSAKKEGYRRLPKVTRLISCSTEFFAGLAEGCKVDDAKARAIWAEFSNGMPWVDRTDFLLNGRTAGLEISKHIVVDASGKFSVKYETAQRS